MEGMGEVEREGGCGGRNGGGGGGGGGVINILSNLVRKFNSDHN